MEEVKIVYKRNSAWWIATCYLLGSIFFLGYALISLVGLFANVGVEGIKAIKEGAEEQRVEDALAVSIENLIQLENYKIDFKGSVGTLALTIKNDSEYAISSVQIEIAELGLEGIPVQVWNQYLLDLDTIYPGRNGYAMETLRHAKQNSFNTYSVRITGFSIVGDNVLREICEQGKEIGDEG
ncbi:MAG: hypothetical protein MI867_16255 [Pseudomonadales bacterium]|nr:hypothetical protein [Pseudomonadales bacterium]